jgi:hypothetical protein
MCRRTRCGEREQRTRAANASRRAVDRRRMRCYTTGSPPPAASTCHARDCPHCRETRKRSYRSWHPFAPPSPSEGRSRALSTKRPPQREMARTPRCDSVCAGGSPRSRSLARARRPRSPRRRVDTEEDPLRTRLQRSTLCCARIFEGD